MKTEACNEIIVDGKRSRKIHLMKIMDNCNSQEVEKNFRKKAKV